MVRKHLAKCHVLLVEPQPMCVKENSKYSIKAEKIQRMSESARTLVKLLQLFFVRLGSKPETAVVRKVDLPKGLTLYDLLFWLFKAIENTEEKAVRVIPTEKAITLINKWIVR